MEHGAKKTISNNFIESTAYLQWFLGKKKLKEHDFYVSRERKPKAPIIFRKRL